MSDEEAKSKQRNCGCEKELWRYSCAKGISSLALWLFGAIYLGRMCNANNGIRQEVCFVLAAVCVFWFLINLSDLIRYCVIGQEVYQFEDVNGKQHTHLIAPLEIGDGWYFYYANELDERRAVKIRHFILKLRNRGIFRTCSFICTDVRPEEWKKIQTWTPEGRCQLFDMSGRSIGRNSTSELLKWMNCHRSTQDYEHYLETIVHSLGIDISVVIERSNRERKQKNGTKSEVGRKMREELERIISELSRLDHLPVMSSEIRDFWAQRAREILDAEAKAAESKAVEEQPV